MRALNRKLLRDLWRIKGQALAIALVIGTGVATFVMSLGVLDSLVETRAAYYERYRFADVFATLKRAPNVLADRMARIPGVKVVDTRIVRDVTLDVAGMEEPATGRLVSIPARDRPRLNDLAISRGRYLSPGRPDEALISEAFAEAHGLGPGDRLSATLNGRKRALTIVGVALSPEYVYSIAPGALMPDDRHFGVLWMSRRALEAAFDLDGAFNDVALALLPDAVTADVIDRLDDLLEPYGGLGAYERADQVSNWFLSGEIEQLKTMTGVLPTIFLAVAAFLLHMVVSRLVATEREQIGLLKAFGYTNAAVGTHYVKLILVLVTVGVVLGSLSGAWLGRSITELYTHFYRFPLLYYRVSPGLFAAAALVGAGAAMAGTVGAIRRAVALPPAEAMVPPPPPLYRRGLLDRLGVKDFFDQPTLMVLRHAGRWPVRSALTATGIALAVAVLVLSLQWIDAIDHMVEVEFFRAQRQDATVTFADAQPRRALRELERLPGVLAAEPFRTVPVRFRLGPRERRGTISGVVPDAVLDVVLDGDDTVVRVPPRGLLLSTKLAELLGAGPGDLVTVEVMEGRRPVRRLPVAAVFETYLGTPAYMDLGALNRLMGEGPTISGAQLRVDPRLQADLYRTLKETPDVASVTLRSAVVGTFRKTLAETILFIVTYYVAFAALLAAGVVYNSARIALSERGRELGSLRVLGFTRLEVSYILLGELGLLTFLALPLGSVIGYGMAASLSRVFDTELYRIPLAIERPTYGFAVGVVLVAAAVTAAAVRRRLDRMNLVEVLKTRE